MNRSSLFLRLRELALLFLKLGSTAFGGPAAHIAMMEEEVVQRRKWLSREKFLDLIGAVNLIPGPNSTELAIHIGFMRAGFAGLLAAGICFILPAFFIVTACAVFYVRYGSLPEFSGLLYGIKPVVIAVVLKALWSLSRTALKTRALAGLCAAAFAAALLGVHELLILLICGMFPVALELLQRNPRKGTELRSFSFPGFVPAAVVTSVSAAAAIQPGLLFWVFFKAGALLFGSGYVLMAFLRADLVQRLGWLTESQLLDAVAVGQVTPGPVFTTATFIGYMLMGFKGACIATAGIFLPAFVFVTLSVPLIPKLRESRIAGAFLDGVNAASLALMGAVICFFGLFSLIDVFTLSVTGICLLLLARTGINSAWLVSGGALAGTAAQSLGAVI